MPVGGLDRYSGLQEGSYVQLNKNSEVKQVGDRSFFGRIVKWHVDNLSKSNTRQQVINRDVRQDFFVALQQSNKEIAKKYAQELVGQGNEQKPLSTRLVKVIMDEVETARTERLQEQRSLVKPPVEDQLKPKLGSMIEIITKFPERDRDLDKLIQDAVNLLAQDRTKNFQKARAELAQMLKSEYEKLSDSDQRAFKGRFAQVKPEVEISSEKLEAEISSRLERLKKSEPTPPPDLETIIETAVNFPERRKEVTEMLRAAAMSIAEEKGTFEGVLEELARRLTDEVGLLSPADRYAFSVSVGSPETLENNIGLRLGPPWKKEETPGPQGTTDTVKQVQIGNPKTTVHEYDRNAPPDTGEYEEFGDGGHPNDWMTGTEKSILKSQRPISEGEVSNEKQYYATQWLSEIQDKALDNLSERHFPPLLIEMLNEFNFHLPDDKKLSIRDFIDHKALNVEGRILSRLDDVSKKGMRQLKDDRVEKEISQAVQDVLSDPNAPPLYRELRSLQKDDSLTDKAKAEAAYRLLHDLQRELAAIGKNKNKEVMDRESSELFQRNRLTVRVEDSLNTMLERQLEPFNRALPNDRQIRPQDIYDRAVIETVMQTVRSTMVEKTEQQLDEFDLEDAIQQGLSEAVKANPVLAELQSLSKDSGLSEKEKGEAMYRLVNELGPQLQEIGGIEDLTERNSRYQALFTENRTLFA